ncbi:MAG: ATP-binding protein [Muribaculaceae bacterium]|nr:ATP-binding protein [Muribaculaceae bacterium]
MKLQIDIKKIIKLLAKDIYDSPFALLRENLQNAYDAVLMRQCQDSSYSDPCIKMIITDRHIVIRDNGIGMTMDVVENNFWKAGSSGKNNDEARRAGVVGTFGIGAMANFGVCERLEVNTRYYNSDETITTILECERISLEEDCIDKQQSFDTQLPIGTTIKATLNPGIKLDADAAEAYLRPYVQYLQIPVFLNDKLISKKSYFNELIIDEKNCISQKKVCNNNGYEYCIFLSAKNHTNGYMSIHISNIKYNNTEIKGEILLMQDGGTIYGLRNGFGLAPIGLGSSFRWGGIANLSNLIPTAGRDSLTRESIDFISHLISLVEQDVVNMFSQLDVCDLNRAFLAYVYQRPSKTIELATNITVRREPTNDRIKLGGINQEIDDKKVCYYPGSDESIINTYANESNYLLVLSNDNIRKNIQARFLQHLNIPLIPDNVFATDYSVEALESSELSIIFRIEYILQSDYLINQTKVFFSEISHNQPIKVEYLDSKLVIHLKRDSNSINYLRQVYQTDYNMFDGFVKDYVRQNIYPRINNYVPSATREGADALMKIMKQKKDLFSIEEKEMGQVDEVISDYLKGIASLADVHRVSSSIYNSQKQEVGVDQTGRVEEVVPSVKVNIGQNGLENNESASKSGLEDDYMPQPSIKRLDYDTNMKLLVADTAYPALNNHTMFLALSDKFYDRYSDFFLEPHSTKIIWSTHKIVYVFTHISSQVSMYYDIDLKAPLPNNLTGGYPIKSTTIITKNKIFVPIVKEMYDYFDLKKHQNKLEFYVRFDTLAS